MGSENNDLPGFVVMLSNNGPGDLGDAVLWDNAFLPAAYRGVTSRSQGEAILHLSNPPGVSRQAQRKRIQTIVDLNRLRPVQHPDPEIDSRIAAYELAFGMQMAGPDLLDFSQESAATLAAYGVSETGENETGVAETERCRNKTNWFGSNCLLARRMVERGVRFVQLYHYTWDDHSMYAG